MIIYMVATRSDMGEHFENDMTRRQPEPIVWNLPNQTWIQFRSHALSHHSRRIETNIFIGLCAQLIIIDLFYNSSRNAGIYSDVLSGSASAIDIQACATIRGLHSLYIHIFSPRHLSNRYFIKQWCVAKFQPDDFAYQYCSVPHTKPVFPN